MKTRSPGLKSLTEFPTSIISPDGSCPSLADDIPYRPYTFSRSEPHRPHVRILTRTSPASNFGGANSSIETDSLPLTETAFINGDQESKYKKCIRTKLVKTYISTYIISEI